MVRPLPELVLFVDECLGSTDVPAALGAAGIECERLKDHFAGGAADEDWLAEVGKRGWVVLTKDQRIRRRHAEFDALLKAGVAAFVLTSGNMTGAAMGEAFVRAYPRIQQTVRDHERPFIAAVDSAGRVRMLASSKRATKKRGS